MSLDVYLVRKRHISYDDCKTFEVDYDVLCRFNITHNLGAMADKAGIYEALWRPYKLQPEYNINENDHTAEYDYEYSHTVYAKDIIHVIKKGLKKLTNNPAYFRKFDSPNGWGIYDNFVPFVRRYLEALIEHPDSIVKVSR